jgi:asparagine synthase (glutamine-hydrolysing)
MRYPRLEDLPRIVRHIDQPSFDGVNTYLVSKAAKDGGLTVALSGLGGDELFGGYGTFRAIPLSITRSGSPLAGVKPNTRP